MDRLYLKAYLSKVNENAVIAFARNHNIYLTYDEASNGLYFIRTHFDELLNCYDKKEYIYYYFSDPFAYKMYQLITIIMNKL